MRALEADSAAQAVILQEVRSDQYELAVQGHQQLLPLL